MTGFLRSVMNSLFSISSTYLPGTLGKQIKDFLTGKIEGRHNFRNFFREIYKQKTAPTQFTMCCWGDSVAHRLWSHFVVNMQSRFGDGGVVYPSLTNNLRVISVAMTGTVAHDIQAVNSATADYQYLPNGGHFIMSNAATLTFSSSNNATFSKVIVWFAKRPGDGSALVEVLDYSSGDSVIASGTVALNGVNGTLERVILNGIDPAKPIKVRVTATGTVCVLTCALLRASGVTAYGMSRGSTTITQQCISNDGIISGILSDLNAVLMIHEDKEESPDTSYPVLIAKMANFTGVDQLFIGSLPDNTTDLAQVAKREICRSYAINNNYAFFDANQIFGSNSFYEVTRLGWNGDGTHLDDAAYYYAAQILLSNLPDNIIGSGVRAPLIESQNFAVKRVDSLGINVPFTQTDTTINNTYGQAITLYNLGRVKFKTLQGECYLSGYGSSAIQALKSDGVTRANLMCGSLDITATTQTGTPPAGVGAALPATPERYVGVIINGVAGRIAVYP